MHTEQLIPVNDFCNSHQIELSFIQTLHQSGLIEVTVTGEQSYIPIEQLERLEKMVRLYYEMDINVEGIETITHLLQQIQQLQKQLRQAYNRLASYESR